MIVTIGKRVGSSIYVHRTALALLANEPGRVLADAIACVGNVEWNVARISKSDVSFLLYEEFEDTAFPALLLSTKTTADGGDYIQIDYSKRVNPPILHRKELLLAPDHPMLPKFRALTAAAEGHGLFADNHAIGTREAWMSRIRDAGLELRGHTLVPAGEEQIEISRHRTAIVRRDLSQPMQIMLRLGVVTSSRSLFDYGCGQGEDVAALASQGYPAFGWDPHHAPGGRREAADVVNLGFVLNIIEDPWERAETLKAAWEFAKAALCVSVMLTGSTQTRGHRPLRDGLVTSRGTFQRYYTQHELRETVSAATGANVLSLAPGIVAAFRDPDLEQEVLLRRRSRAFATEGALPRPPIRERLVVARPDLRDRLEPVVGVLRDVATKLGRLPEPDEAPPEVHAALEEIRVGWPRAVDVLSEAIAEFPEFAAAARSRREDLLVHFALQQFPGAPKYRRLPRSVQADVKAFFGRLASAEGEANRLLFSTGDRAGLKADAEAAAASGLGGWRGPRFRFASRALPRLPARLRVLVGCAEILQGGAVGCDFVDVEPDAAKVTMISCDDAAASVPFVLEKLRIDLARLKVFADRREAGVSPIFFKSRYLPVEERDEHSAFEGHLMATGLFADERNKPKWSDVEVALGTHIEMPPAHR